MTPNNTSGNGQCMEYKLPLLQVLNKKLMMNTKLKIKNVDSITPHECWWHAYELHVLVLTKTNTKLPKNWQKLNKCPQFFVFTK
jgi:hypothetical protein